MNGQIFISYRREDASHAAGRLYDHLAQNFPKSRIFMDIDNLEPGENFAEEIGKSVGSCDILIALIGRHWLDACDPDGNRRLDNPDDWIRLEVSNALNRGIRVIPVLVDGALMPRSTQLPDDLQPIVHRQAVELSHTRFPTDSERIISAINRAFEKAALKQREREEQEQLEAAQPQREEKKERFWSLNAFYRTLTRDFAAQPWIRKIDKLSWLPFAAVSAILLCYALSRGYFPYGPYNLDTFDFWLGTLLWVALPSLVTISSFLNYPKRRIFEVIVSLVFLPVSAYFLLTSYSTSTPPFVKYFFITFARETKDQRYNFTITLLVLPVLGAIMKLWLLTSNRRNKTAAIVKTP
jgi:hypothetical protein